MKHENNYPPPRAAGSILLARFPALLRAQQRVTLNKSGTACQLLDFAL